MIVPKTTLLPSGRDRKLTLNLPVHLENYRLNRQRLGVLAAVLVCVKISYSQWMLAGTLNSVVFLWLAYFSDGASRIPPFSSDLIRQLLSPSIYRLILFVRLSKISWSVSVCALSEKR
jgi:hypothetical protein